MSATDDLNNPHLFDENEPGNYTYTETAYGKTASGQLHTATSPDRDALAQRTAGGEDRRTAGNEYGVDDGGHLIGARFGGATGQENLTPQDRNLNRGDYKRAENEWADRLEKGDKVYVHMESYTGDGSERPTNYMGYAIFEHTDEHGKTTREIEYYSFNNESRAEQESWDKAQTQAELEDPSMVENQRAENTTMPYIWDEDKQDVVENPYYVPETEQAQEQEQANPYGTGNDLGTGDTVPEESQDQSNPYGVSDETSASQETANNAYIDTTPSQETANDPSMDSGSYDGGSADNGQDMD